MSSNIEYGLCTINVVPHSGRPKKIQNTAGPQLLFAKKLASSS